MLNPYNTIFFRFQFYNLAFFEASSVELEASREAVDELFQHTLPLRVHSFAFWNGQMHRNA